MKLKHRNRVRKPLTPQEKVSIAQCYNAGMKILDIQAKFNISRSTVANVVNEKIN